MEDNIGEDVPVQIHQLANGFLVRPYIRQQDMGMSIGLHEEYVFNNFTDMVKFLEKHFTHRSHEQT